MPRFIPHLIAAVSLTWAMGSGMAATGVEPTQAAQAETPAPASGASPEAPVPGDETPAGPADPEGTESFDDEVSVGEIPAVETIELTADLSKRALDAYIIVRDKYKDADLENFDSLQEFVDQGGQGKAFEADIKAHGFTTVDEWNIAITTLSFAYGNIVENQTDDIQQQIEEIKSDTEMAQDMKDRMVKSLQAMIPSENNVKVVEELVKDQSYAEKLKQLDVESE